MGDPSLYITLKKCNMTEQNRRGGRGVGTCRSSILKIGSLNVRGCSTSMSKRSEIGSMFESRKMDVLALSETKVKGKGECVFGGVIGRVSGVEGGRAREGVGIIVREELKQYVVEWKEV